MDKKQFGLFGMALKAYYPKENILPSEQAVQLWYMQLQDIDYNDATMFLNKWAATEKWSPSIADIRGGIADITNGTIEDWGKGWAQVEKAIRNFGSYRVEDAYNSMDEITREVTQRLGFLNICQSENIQTDRANFRMLYEQVAARVKQERQISPSTRAAIAQRTAALLEDNKFPVTP